MQVNTHQPTRCRTPRAVRWLCLAATGTLVTGCASSVDHARPEGGRCEVPPAIQVIRPESTAGPPIPADTQIRPTGSQAARGRSDSPIPRTDGIWTRSLTDGHGEDAEVRP